MKEITRIKGTDSLAVMIDKINSILERNFYLLNQTIISKTEPPHDTHRLWLKPMGRGSMSGIPSGIPAIKLNGVYVGNDQPIVDGKVFWAQPLDKSESQSEPHEVDQIGTTALKVYGAYINNEDKPPDNNESLWVKPL